MINLYNGDCLEVMKDIPDGSIDLVLCDPPYGTIKGIEKSKASKDCGYRNCDWDIKIDTREMFTELSRILRQNGKAILFGQEPYTSELITEAIASLPFSYRAIWLKNSPGNILGCKSAMVNLYEDIVIYSKIHPKHDFSASHPLRDYSAKCFKYIGKTKKEIISLVGQCSDHFFRFNSSQFTMCTEDTYAKLIELFNIDKMQDFKPFDELHKIDVEFRTKLIDKMNAQNPSVFNLWQGGKCKNNVLEYAKDNDGYHPTQKPVLLLEDLIKTYSNEGDTVLDFTMGSGSTGVACVNTGRSFIGIELDPEYYAIAEERIHNAT